MNKQFRPDESYVKERLLSIILSKDAEEYIGFKAPLSEEADIGELLENVEKYVGYLVKEKTCTEEKYQKLFNIHNRMIEINSRKSGIDNTEGKYKLADANIHLNSELNKLKEAKRY